MEQLPQGISKKYWDHLVTTSKNIDVDLAKFNVEIQTLLNAQTDWLGAVLKCHLIIEYYLDRYLHVSHSTMPSMEKARLTFIQKLELANNPHTLFKLYYLPIKSLNSLRNKFSHRISYQVTADDLSEIQTIINTWQDALGEPRLVGLELLSRFTIHVCGWINSTIRDIEGHGKEMGLAGYLSWVKEMMK